MENSKKSKLEILFFKKNENRDFVFHQKDLKMIRTVLDWFDSVSFAIELFRASFKFIWITLREIPSNRRRWVFAYIFRKALDDFQKRK